MATKRPKWRRPGHVGDGPSSSVPPLLVGPREVRNAGRSTGVGVLARGSSAPIWAEISLSRVRPSDSSPAELRLGHGAEIAASVSPPGGDHPPSSHGDPVQSLHPGAGARVCDASAHSTAEPTASETAVSPPRHSSSVFGLPRARVRVLTGGKLLRTRFVSNAPMSLLEELDRGYNPNPHSNPNLSRGDEAYGERAAGVRSRRPSREAAARATGARGAVGFGLLQEATLTLQYAPRPASAGAVSVPSGPGSVGFSAGASTVPRARREQAALGPREPTSAARSNGSGTGSSVSVCLPHPLDSYPLSVTPLRRPFSNVALPGLPSRGGGGHGEGARDIGSGSRAAELAGSGPCQSGSPPRDQSLTHSGPHWAAGSVGRAAVSTLPMPAQPSEQVAGVLGVRLAAPAPRPRSQPRALGEVVARQAKLIDGESETASVTAVAPVGLTEGAREVGASVAPARLEAAVPKLHGGQGSHRDWGHGGAAAAAAPGPARIALAIPTVSSPAAMGR